jgi:ABC-2 type transport system permease protein
MSVASLSLSMAGKDWLEFRRDRRLVLVAVLVTLLALAAVLTAWAKVASHEADRIATIAADRETWEGQGARNPHSAAHFSFWALRPLAPMALLDPGVTPHAGSAVWMEAHNRNPAQARPVEDLATGLDLGSFSAAWVMQTIMPLLIFVIGAGMVARERERGTLRLMLASGASPGGLVPAKLGGLARITALLALPLLGAAVLASTLAGAVQPAALLLWVAVYFLWFALLAAIAIAVSALLRTAAQAQLLLIGLWLLAALVVPRAGAGLAGALAPVPDPNSFATQVQTALREGPDPFEGDGAKAFETEVMARYKVSRLEDLPINIDGLRLNASEDHGDEVFDRVWAGLEAQYARQHDVMRWTAILSPLVPLQNVSMALACTDTAHQLDFQAQAEAHRRRLIRLLNLDFAEHAGAKGFDYLAGPELWKQIPDFTYRPMPLSRVVANILPDLLALAAWAGLAVLLLVLASRRLVRQGI